MAKGYRKGSPTVGRGGRMEQEERQGQGDCSFHGKGRKSHCWGAEILIQVKIVRKD